MFVLPEHALPFEDSHSSPSVEVSEKEAFKGNEEKKIRIQDLPIQFHSYQSKDKCTRLKVKYCGKMKLGGVPKDARNKKVRIFET